MLMTLITRLLSKISIIPPSQARWKEGEEERGPERRRGEVEGKKGDDQEEEEEGG